MWFSLIRSKLTNQGKSDSQKLIFDSRFANYTSLIRALVIPYAYLFLKQNY